MLPLVTRCLFTAGLLATALTACDHQSPDVHQDPISNAPPELDPSESAKRHRYAFNDQCVVISAQPGGPYLTGAGPFTTTEDIAGAAAFYMKPSALGKYLFYTAARNLVSADGASLGTVPLMAPTEAAEWTVLGVGDSENYPPTPVQDEEPTGDAVATYLAYEDQDPHIEYEAFTVTAESAGVAMSIAADGTVGTAASGSNIVMTPVDSAACAQFPEAQSNASGVPFKGTATDPIDGSKQNVVGMAEVHLHITSTTFLGEAKSGWPYHKFGVTHAVGDCTDWHGERGERSPITSVFEGSAEHDTTGYPTFPVWPSRGRTLHEAVYWKWLERAWYGGLRLIVNDAVENETLCKIQKNALGEPTRDCNEMNQGAKQLGTAYGMMDYIDAQMGGRGEGWFRIVHNPEDARRVIADGKIAVILGFEVSNVLNCKMQYGNPRNGETGNTYECNMKEGSEADENSIETQLNRLHALGVRQLFPIHEFDNAFGGNGIFEGTIFNLGTRENSGGVPAGGGPSPIVGTTVGQANLPAAEYLGGEFWTTYDCPDQDYINGAGAFIPSQGAPYPGCVPTGDGGTFGGTTACYPPNTNRNQCNARWMTPIGYYAFQKFMEKGIVFELDHLELEIKSQVLDIGQCQHLSEADCEAMLRDKNYSLTPAANKFAYPSVSSHGGHGGVSLEQAERIYKVGGYVYPGLGSTRDFMNWIERLKPIHAANAPANTMFAVGFGTDTNGLSAQAGPRGSDIEGKEVNYPYTLFEGGVFDDPALADMFGNAGPVVFDQPHARDPDGNGRDWHIDQDGHAHYGMLSGTIEEMKLEGATPAQMRAMFNGAEYYLRVWEQTLAAAEQVRNEGFVGDSLVGGDPEFARKAPGVCEQDAYQGTPYCAGP